MRSLSLGIMSSPGGIGANPFGQFALGAAALQVAADSSATPSTTTSRQFVEISTRRVTMKTDDSRPEKKMRGAAVISAAGVTGGAAAAGESSAATSEGPKGLVEKYRSPSEPEWPLRVIIIGHNPSDTAWQQGHYYAHPSNQMYKLLGMAKIIPDGFAASDDDKCPITCGVGFTDVGFSIPGTASSKFTKADLHAWRQGFYNRLTAHAERAAVTVARANAAAAEGGFVNESEAEDSSVDVRLGYPKIVTFAGKRQWEELFYDASKQVKARTKGGKNGPFRFGLQPQTLRPPGWPFPVELTEIFVVPSSSGAAAMTRAARESPYIELGKRVQAMAPWTRRSAVAADLG